MTEWIKIDEFCRVCRLAKLLEVKAGVPAFCIANKTEGIELKNNKIITFSVVDGERDYDAAIQSRDILAVVGAFEQKPESEAQKPEQKATKSAHEDLKDMGLPESAKKLRQELIPETVGLPDLLTPALMSKWAKMTTTDRILMFQRTPPDQIYDVAVGKNPETGKLETAPYVKGNYMFKEANAAFLFDWYMSDIVISICPTGVSVSGKLNAWFSEYGKYLSRPATGYQELNKKVDVEQAKKGATTDAIKKGLSLFGFNSDVFR